MILAGAGYLLWNAQLNPFLNTAMPFFGLFNVGMALLNVAPFYPFDGGRLARAIVWGLLGRPAASTRLAMRLGFLAAALLVAWGIVLFAQPVRFHEQTGLATLGLAALALLALGLHGARGWEGAVGETAVVPAAFVPVATGLALVMLAVSSILVPVNNGLEAPGVALSVEPMVQVPPEYRHEPAGTFILTSVIQQAPITFGEWVFGQLSPAVRIVPPEVIVPPDTTPQEQARQGYRMLDESEVTASVVGLRLAGYDARAEGKGVLVDSVLQDSPALGLLQPGDVIDGLNGEPVRSREDLIDGLAAESSGDTARLRIQHDGQTLELAVPLMPPASAGGPPRLGISVESAGVSYTLPFPVKIEPQKIVGGPSAGLMFTLAVYNAVTPDDLTGGRRIAGTGTIALDGTVGPIGGVEEKVVAAELAGAQYFLSPAENYPAARAAARRIEVVEVDTAEQAVQFLKGLPPATQP